MRYIWILMGIVIDLFSAVMILGILIGFKMSEIPMFIFFLLSGAGGTLLVTSNLKKINKEKYQMKEKKILKIIQKLGGKVSPLEIATETEMTARESEEFLRELCHNGYGEEQIAANDSVIYVFDGFLSDGDRADSKRLLDVQ